MLFTPPYNIYLSKGILWISLFVLGCTSYAYLINARRPNDDPQKRDFHPAAIFLAPITWPLFLLAFVTIFVLRALVYGIFLILFTIALVAIRQSFLLIWLQRMALFIGNKLLEANTFLIRAAFGGRGGGAQPI